MSSATVVWGKLEHLLGHITGVATMIEDIVAQVALDDRSAASEVQSKSLLLLGPPGAGKLTGFAYQVQHKKIAITKSFQQCWALKQRSTSW